MSRTKGLVLMDGSPYPYDFIPRVGGNGKQRIFNPPVGAKVRTPAFEMRVIDATCRLKRGQSIEEIRKIHGCIVVRTAFHDIHPKARIVG